MTSFKRKKFSTGSSPRNYFYPHSLTKEMKKRIRVRVRVRVRVTGFSSRNRFYPHSLTKEMKERNDYPSIITISSLKIFNFKI
jgi:hypothetical protein